MHACVQALVGDPNFLRVSKGAYSLHCLHPDKEQLVRAPQPKEPKPSKKTAEGETSAAAKPKEEKEAVPMIRVEPKMLEVRHGCFCCSHVEASSSAEAGQVLCG